MLLPFRKRKIKDKAKANTTEEKTVIHIVSVCIHFQKKWAGLMQLYSERFSRKGKIAMLFLFCIIGGSLSLYVLAHRIMGRSAVSFTVTQVKETPFAGKSGDEDTKATIIVTKAEYIRIQRFRLYMDSLAGSSSGKKVCDSILKYRPDLMDSVLFIENIYQSQKKR